MTGLSYQVSLKYVIWLTNYRMEAERGIQRRDFNNIFCVRSSQIGRFQIPYFSIDNARVIYTKRSKFAKNEHARYTLGMKKGKNLERLITATSQASF